MATAVEDPILNAQRNRLIADVGPVYEASNIDYKKEYSILKEIEDFRENRYKNKNYITGIERFTSKLYPYSRDIEIYYSPNDFKKESNENDINYNDSNDSGGGPGDFFEKYWMVFLAIILIIFALIAVIVVLSLRLQKKEENES